MNTIHLEFKILISWIGKSGGRDCWPSASRWRWLGRWRGVGHQSACVAGRFWLTGAHLGIETSRSSGRFIAFGETSTGRLIAVVYDEVDEDAVYPVTAYDVEP